MNRGNNRKPWYSRGGFSNANNQKDKPLFAVNRKRSAFNGLGGGNSDSDDDTRQAYQSPRQNTETIPTDTSFSTEREAGSFVGWKLYFPEKSFKESADLVRRVRAMEKHFKSFPQWYDIDEIEQTCVLQLNIQQLEDDGVLAHDWGELDDELRYKSTQTLACFALAMHNIIVNAQTEDCGESYEHKKIYSRPLGFQPQISINQACQTNGELVSVTGTVVRVEPVTINPKMICFRCSTCGTSLVVKYNKKSSRYTRPSSCQKGCNARGNFIEVLSSPYSIYQPKQMVRIQESTCVENKEFRVLDVELIQNQVGTIVPGQVITVTGVLKHQNDKSKAFMKKESKFLKYYLKCFSVDSISKFLTPKREQMTSENEEFICQMKAQPSTFRLLVHSLAPSIFGREEVKAGLILSLLSGQELLDSRRSESHILLVGNPGTGKSKLLQFCADVSSNGIFVSGPTLTSIGLTAKVGKNGTIDAGALILANGGACCIDEFDKALPHMNSLLEAMEQQIISISKCGVKINAPSKVVIIAAANPVSSFYDPSKTILENVKISTPLLSRFDLIFPISNHSKSSDEQFMAHISARQNLDHSMKSNLFFDSANTTVSQMRQERPGLGWLRAAPGEKIDALPVELLQLLIAYAREKIKPELSDEAVSELRDFFANLRKISAGNEVQPVTFRQLEGLKRLTLSRARADLSEIATRDHAIDVINLFKFTMIDVFAADETAEAASCSILAKKSKVQNVSTLSKPKQTKALLERFREEVDTQGRNFFTNAEIKDMAKELGIRDYSEIIFRLNTEGLILRKPDGYEIQDD